MTYDRESALYPAIDLLALRLDREGVAIDEVLEVARTVGGFAGTVATVLVAVYLFPNSPVRRAVERWIDGRVDHRFAKELEHYRHQLAMDAEAIRAEHQRLLYNAALVTERKHEVFRELFRVTHIGTGAVAHLYGMREEPTFEDNTADDIDGYMKGLKLPAGVRDPILADWSGRRAEAIAELKRIMRRLEVQDAERLYAEAWNYYLTNSLYLQDPISQKAAQIFTSLRDILAIAKFPDGIPGQDVGTHKDNAIERLEELRLLLRAELKVS